MSSGTSGSRRKPGNILYSNETMWQQQNSKKSPSTGSGSSHNPVCKCKKEMVEQQKEDDCDNCNKNEEIKINKVLRDAQTSPRLVVEDSPTKQRHEMSPLKECPGSGKSQRKQLLSPSKLETSPPTSGTRVLEKSNSLNDSKPTKLLRTTKSFSPRPPVRHQHAITVSDESNTVSVKVSPADDFDDLMNLSDTKSITNDNSPESNVISVSSSLRLNSRHKNKSFSSLIDSCLVTDPLLQDPWEKMEPSLKEKKKTGSRMKKLMDAKSNSRPDLVSDPWVFDESRGPIKDSSKKASNYRHSQSKSLHVESKSGTARARLQRSKSPIFIPDVNPKNPPTSPTSTLSPKDPLSSLSPKLGYHSFADDKARNAKKKSQFLNVSNPNLLQPRHSFSTTSKKDDELTLNIRRLSEQIKYTNYGSYGNFPNVSTANTSPKPVEMDKKSASLLSDSLLETTC